MDEMKKEKAIPIPSAPTDGERPVHNVDNNSITKASAENKSTDAEFEKNLRNIRKLNDPANLPTVTMQELYGRVFESRPPVIDGLLCSGTYFLAGAPKVGKSFLAAQLAYHVSTGQPLWDHAVQQGTVLYLALEDDYARLQRRMYRMFGVEGTDKLHLAIAAKQLGGGLDEQLDKFVREHPDTRLIIIDTFQKIRQMGGEAYSYADDYHIIGRLKRFADQRGLCLVLVHHTRKAPAKDTFEMISGTTGLFGCADGAFVLHKTNRSDKCAVLDVVGRDQPDQKLYLTQNEEHLIWELDHAERELWKEPPDPLLEAIASKLTEEAPEWSGSATDLAVWVGADMQPNALTKRLNVKAGNLLSEYNIRYENVHSRTGSQIKLTLIKTS